MPRPRKKAVVDKQLCVACGSCIKACPRDALTVPKGIHAEVSLQQCVGCGLCVKACPASVIEIKDRGDMNEA